MKRQVRKSAWISYMHFSPKCEFCRASEYHTKSQHAKSIQKFNKKMSSEPIKLFGVDVHITHQIR